MHSLKTFHLFFGGRKRRERHGVAEKCMFVASRILGQKSLNNSIEQRSTPELGFLTQTALLADSRKTGEDEVITTFLINFLNANLPKRKIKFFLFNLDSFANSFKKMGRHVHIMVKYDSFFPICDFCTAQHFLLTCMKLNRSVFYFTLKVLLLPTFSLNYEGSLLGSLTKLCKNSTNNK